MGGEGSMAAMNSSLKYNRDQVKNRRNPFNKEKLEGFPNKYHKAIRIKQMSKVKLERLKLKLKEDRRQETLRIAFAILTSVGIALAIILTIIHYIKETSVQ